MRNFIKIISWNGHSYDIDIGWRDEVQCFFNKYNNESQQNTQQARNDWAFLTSNHPEVKYRKKEIIGSQSIQYEMDSGSYNMLKLINALHKSIITKWTDISFGNYNLVTDIDSDFCDLVFTPFPI